MDNADGLRDPVPTRRSRTRPPVWLAFGRGLVLASLVLMMSLLSMSVARAESDGLDVTSRSTFELIPARRRVEVRVDLVLTNRRPSTVRIVPCPGSTSQRCRQRISYYVDRWGYIVVQRGARGLRISGPGVRARIAKRNGPWVGYVVRFPRAFYGQSRRIRLTYWLPGGGPRSATPTRVTQAYAHFCWHGQPSDRGLVTAVLPGGFETQTYGARVRTRASRRTTVVRAPDPGRRSRSVLCTDAFAPDGLVRTEASSLSGQRVVVEGWPEDPSWTTSVTEDLPMTLSSLELAIGLALPQDGIVIRQVAAQALDGYAADYSPTRGQIRVGESLTDPTVVAHELAHAWFNGATLADLWLIEGYAEWAGTTVTHHVCPARGDYPGRGSPQLRRWRFLGSDPSRTDQAVVEYQYDAACGIIAEIADRVGPTRMRAITAALLTREPTYARAAAARGSDRPVPDWREWLDAVDELGLLPTGYEDLGLAERLLLEQGIARPGDLRGRSEARSVFHAAVARQGPRLPALVPRLMDDWRFDDAVRAIEMTDATLLALRTAAASGAIAHDVARVQSHLAAASSLSGLRAVRDEARRLVRAD